MKRVADIIRELIEEDAFIRRHEPQIIQYCADRAARIKHSPQAVTKDEAVTESRIA
jgi:hypothetical protein